MVQISKNFILRYQSFQVTALEWNGCKLRKPTMFRGNQGSRWSMVATISSRPHLKNLINNGLKPDSLSCVIIFLIFSSLRPWCHSQNIFQKHLIQSVGLKLISAFLNVVKQKVLGFMKQLLYLLIIPRQITTTHRMCGFHKAQWPQMFSTNHKWPEVFRGHIAAHLD